MRYFGKVALQAVLIIGAGLICAKIGGHIGEELSIRYEMKTTGALDRAELAGDYGLIFVAAIFHFPGLLIGWLFGVAAMWLVLLLLNGTLARLMSRRLEERDATTA